MLRLDDLPLQLPDARLQVLNATAVSVHDLHQLRLVVNQRVHLILLDRVLAEAESRSFHGELPCRSFFSLVRIFSRYFGLFPGLYFVVFVSDAWLARAGDGQ